MKNWILFYAYLTLILILNQIAGCGTLAPGASEITVTRDTHSVMGCEILGSVDSNTNVLFGDWNGAGWYKIRNQALALHADTLLLTTVDSGVAYRCKGH